MKHLSKEQREDMKGEIWWAVITAGIVMILLGSATIFTAYVYLQAFLSLT